MERFIRPVCSGAIYASVPAINSGGSRAWRSRGSREAIPKPISQHWPGAGVYQNVGRLDILVDDAALMQVTNRSRKANGQTQRKRYVQWLAEKLFKGPTA